MSIAGSQSFDRLICVALSFSCRASFLIDLDSLFRGVPMARYRIFVSILSLALAACMTLACGSSNSAQRTIQSITLSPASANAQDYPSGAVQFVATGHYATQPYTVTPLQTQWGPPAGFPGSGVVVDSNGVAKCVASGTYSVGAWANLPAHDEVPCAIGQFGQPVCYTVVGTAKLTCP